MGLIHARSKDTHGEYAVIIKRMGLLYGYRGSDPGLTVLSPYGFIRHWQVLLMGARRTRSPATSNIEYVDGRYVPLELANSWYMVRRSRPTVPVFHGCPMPRSAQRERTRAATILLSYIHPWTFVPEWACDHVPHVSAWFESSQCVAACATWLGGRILTE